MLYWLYCKLKRICDLQRQNCIYFPNAASYSCLMTVRLYMALGFGIWHLWLESAVAGTGLDFGDSGIFFTQRYVIFREHIGTYSPPHLQWHRLEWHSGYSDSFWVPKRIPSVWKSSDRVTLADSDTYSLSQQCQKCHCKRGGLYYLLQNIFYSMEMTKM